MAMPNRTGVSRVSDEICRPGNRIGFHSDCPQCPSPTETSPTETSPTAASHREPGPISLTAGSNNLTKHRGRSVGRCGLGAAMSIRAKFFALAGILLLLFGAVVGALSVLQADTAHKLEAIVRHYQPLRRLLADLDVATDEYELRVERLRRQPNRPPDELKQAAAEIEQVGARIQAGFEKLSAELDAAEAHDRDDPDHMQVLARVQGALPLIGRQVAPFIAVGKRVTDALVSGQLEKAHEEALDFTKYEDAFGPDLAEMRQEVTDLTEQATASIYANQHVDATFSFILFVIAAGVGLGISGFGSKQVVAALRKLLVSTRAIEAGHTDIT